MQVKQTVHGLHPHRGAIGQAAVMDKPHKASGSIATVLDLAAIGVVDDVAEVNPLGTWRWRAHAQDLVGTHPEMPIGQTPVVRGRQTEHAAGLIEHDEIVAGSLHFGKGDPHGAIILRDSPGRRAEPGWLTMSPLLMERSRCHARRN
jgi:hypothetical protein